MDNDIRYQLNCLISEQVTKEQQLNPTLMSKIKNYVKISDDYVKVAYEQIFHHLEANNSGVILYSNIRKG